MLAAKICILSMLVIISTADMRKMIIPDICILLLLPLSLISAEPWKPRIIAAAAVWTAFFLTAILCALFRKEVPLGMGDIKLFSAIALISGPTGLAASIIVSSLSCGVFAAILVVLKKAQKKDQIAFGPFIAMGYALYLASVAAI